MLRGPFCGESKGKMSIKQRKEYRYVIKNIKKEEPEKE
jgi:hypothetical protein